MVKRCLSCNNLSDNNMFACSACLNKINEIRHPLELRKIFKKETMLTLQKINKIIFIFILPLIMILIVAVVIIPLFNKVNEAGLSPFAKMIILSPSLIGFLIYLFAGTIFMRYAVTLWLQKLSDIKYYNQNLWDRIKDLRSSFKPLLFFFVLILISWIAVNILVISIDAFWNIKFNEPLSKLREIFARSLINIGFILGVYISLRYSDWIKGLEK